MLDVRRLRLLRELAHRGTIAAVAAALAYTPSAVSQQLSALERGVRCPAAGAHRTARGAHARRVGPRRARRGGAGAAGARSGRPRGDPRRAAGPLLIGAFPAAATASCRRRSPHSPGAPHARTVRAGDRPRRGRGSAAGRRAGRRTRPHLRLRRDPTGARRGHRAPVRRADVPRRATHPPAAAGRGRPARPTARGAVDRGAGRHPLRDDDGARVRGGGVPPVGGTSSTTFRPCWRWWGSGEAWLSSRRRRGGRAASPRTGRGAYATPDAAQHAGGLPARIQLAPGDRSVRAGRVPTRRLIWVSTPGTPAPGSGPGGPRRAAAVGTAASPPPRARRHWSSAPRRRAVNPQQRGVQVLVRRGGNTAEHVGGAGGGVRIRAPREWRRAPARTSSMAPWVISSETNACTAKPAAAGRRPARNP